MYADVRPPPPGWPRVPGRLSALPECLVLAALLHLLLVAVLGSAPGGSARPGEGVWGALNIRLAGTDPARSAAEQPPLPDAYSGPPGQAAERRWGGTVRDITTPEPADQPGAARLGTWNPARTAADADPLPPALARPTRPAADAAPPSAAPAPAPAPLPAQTPLPSPAPPAPERAELRAPPAEAPAETVSPVPAVPAAPAAPAVSAVPAELPALPPPVMAADPAPLPVQVAVPVPAPVQTPETTPAPVLRELRDTATSRPLRAAEPLPSVPAPLAPFELPAAAAPAIASLPPTAQPSPTRLLAVPPTLSAATALPPSAPVALPSVPAAATAPPLQEIPRAPSPRGVPSVRPAEATAAAPPQADERPLPARPAFGAPDAGAERGHDVATAPAAPASAPRLNLDLVRPRGGEISRGGSRGVFNLLPHPPEMKKLADDIQKSARPDCRTAYSSLGLIGAVPLAADALRKEGCRW